MDYNQIWKQHEKAVNYKNSENFYDKVTKNERYYSGDQWSDVKANNLPQPTMDFLSQIVDLKVSTTMAEEIMIHRLPDELSTENEQVIKATKSFTKMDNINWVRTDMKDLNEKVLLDSAIAGTGATFWYWDNDITTGNDFVVKGDFVGETVDTIDIDVANPNLENIQDQDWIIISYRKTVKKVKEMAKNFGLEEMEIESIQGDNDNSSTRFDKESTSNQNRSKQSNLVTVLLRMEKKDGKVHFTKSTKDLLLQEETNTELELYPLALMTWKPRKKFIYGNSEIEHIIKNQQYVNKAEALRQLHTILMSAPKLLYDRTKIQGVTNQIGGMHGVNGDITNTMQFIQPKQMTIDIDKAVDNVINYTREFKGVNENILGVSRPENTSALLAQQQASNVPLESIKRRFYKYLRDVADIWLDFYKNKYNIVRKVLVEEQDERLEILFKGTDFKNIYMKTKIDIGANTQYSELASKETLDMLLAGGHINIVQYLERYPGDNIPEKDKLIEELGGSGGLDREFKFEMMARFLDTLDDETRARLMNIPKEEREQAIMEVALQQQPNVPPQGYNVSETASNPQMAGQQRANQQRQMETAGVRQNAVTPQQQGLPRNV